jgi:uncharacterized protein (DUF1501 family)
MNPVTRRALLTIFGALGFGAAVPGVASAGTSESPQQGADTWEAWLLHTAK